MPPCLERGNRRFESFMGDQFLYPGSLMVRTLAFQVGNTGSIPVQDAKQFNGLLVIMGARGLCTSQVRVRFSYGPPILLLSSIG